MNMFKLGQIVNGKMAGTFRIQSFTTIDGVKSARVKCVNPDDFQQLASGSIVLPLSKLVANEN